MPPHTFGAKPPSDKLLVLGIQFPDGNVLQRFRCENPREAYSFCVNPIVSIKSPTVEIWFLPAERLPNSMLESGMSRGNQVKTTTNLTTGECTPLASPPFRDSSSREIAFLRAIVSGTSPSPAGPEVDRTAVGIAPPWLSPRAAAVLPSMQLDSRTAVCITPSWALLYLSSGNALNRAGFSYSSGYCPLLGYPRQQRHPRRYRTTIGRCSW